MDSGEEIGWVFQRKLSGSWHMLFQQQSAVALLNSVRFTILMVIFSAVI